jgi:RNA polymerase sigma-70 factor, ECF subfamily
MLLAAAVRFPNRNEADLIQASKRGDLGAFEEIYRAQAGRMKSVAYHLLRDHADAEDAVQEAFLKIYRGAGAIPPESGLAPWVYRILLNCCYDKGRQRRRRAEQPLEHQPAAASNIPLQIAVRDALARIHPQHSLVFWLFEVEGFRHSEVAAILEIPEGTSKKWLFEAKKELKRLLMEGRDAVRM